MTRGGLSEKGSLSRTLYPAADIVVTISSAILASLNCSRPAGGADHVIQPIAEWVLESFMGVT
jgi:hypothetical protein